MKTWQFITVLIAVVLVTGALQNAEAGCTGEGPILNGADYNNRCTIGMSSIEDLMPKIQIDEFTFTVDEEFGGIKVFMSIHESAERAARAKVALDKYREKGRDAGG